MDVEAPRVARHCQPGQFVIVKMDEKGERIPLTICDYDREAGTVTIVFQIVGASTDKMAELKEGDYFRDFTGPLGCASEFVEEDQMCIRDRVFPSCSALFYSCLLFHLKKSRLLFPFTDMQRRRKRAADCSEGFLQNCCARQLESRELM